MAILVDHLHGFWRGKRWCHMVSDRSLTELHRFAKRLGLQRRWFQDHPRHPHYDITERKRELAVLMGAEQVGWPEMVVAFKAMAKQRANETD